MTQIKSPSWKNIPLKAWLFFFAFVVINMAILNEYIKPFLAERHFRDGFNLHVAQRYKYSIIELKKAIDYAPWETHYMAELGRTIENYAKSRSNTQFKQSLNLELEQLYLSMIEIDPKNPWYKNKLANTYTTLSALFPQQENTYQELAHTYHLSASNADKNNPLFQLNYAFYLHQYKTNLDDINKSIPYYKTVFQMDDRILEAPFNLADVYKKNNQLELAIEQYLEIYKRDKNYKNITTAIASAYIDLSQLDKALPFLIELHNQAPNNSNVLQNLAGVYYQLQQWKNSAISYKKLFDIVSESKPLYFEYYIQALVNAYEFNTAYLELTSYSNENPKNASLKKQLNKLRALLKK